MSRPLAHRGAVAAAGTAALLLAVLTASQAQASPLYACVKKNGSARVFRKKPKCKKGESRLSWNKVGPAGKNGRNGAAGAKGAPGSGGPRGQPQKAVAFNVGSEAALVPSVLTTAFSLDGVTVRLSCHAGISFNNTALEAAAGSGLVESGQVNSNSEGGATEQTQQSVWDNTLVASGVPFAKLITNLTAPAGNMAHVNASIATPSSVIVIDAFLSVGFSTPECQARGIAYSIPV